MCKCTPQIRTPFCGAPGCEWPKDKHSPAFETTERPKDKPPAGGLVIEEDDCIACQ